MPVKKPIKVGIVDFWAPMEEVVGEHLFRYLAEAGRVHFTLDDPDLIVYSVYGQEHRKYSCYRVLYTGDNIRPNLAECDFSLSFFPSGRYNFQLPVFVLFDYFQECLEGRPPMAVQQWRKVPKTKFCNFFYSNGKAKERIEFYHVLSKYKRVDSPGKVCNNMPRFDDWADWDSKLAFQAQYKFTIAFENAQADHYTSEKLYHPLLVNSVPIYWGNKRAGEYFNSKAFIHASDFGSFEQLAAYIEYLDNNDEAYLELAGSPMFPEHVKPEFFKDRIVANFRAILDHVAHPGNKPIAQSFLKRQVRRLANRKEFPVAGAD